MNQSSLYLPTVKWFCYIPCLLHDKIFFLTEDVRIQKTQVRLNEQQYAFINARKQNQKRIKRK